MHNKISGEQPSFKALHNARQVEVGVSRETNDAERYLRRIAGGPGVSFQFRAIHDRDKSRPSVNVCGTFERCSSRLTRLNQAGYGVFVVINESEGTTDATVTGARCVFVDLDRPAEIERKERLLYFAGSPITVNIHKAWAGIAPVSMIVESSLRKHHLYWHCHAMPLDRFKPFQRELAYVFGGDAAVCNLSRVMRVPGFLHQKGKPFLSRVLHVRSGHPNSIGADNLERALARTRKRFKVEVPEAKAVVPPIATNKDPLPREMLRGIQGIRDCVAGADEGTRNDLLYWGACRYKEKEAEGWITRRYAEEMLLEAAREAGLPDPEISRTFRSAWGAA
jgi:hypothetical protein